MGHDSFVNYEGWGSLFICIVYPVQISPEQAFRSLKKERWSKPLPEYRQINQEVVEEARDIIRRGKISPQELELRLKVNRYELIDALKNGVKKAPV